MFPACTSWLYMYSMSCTLDIAASDLTTKPDEASNYFSHAY